MLWRGQPEGLGERRGDPQATWVTLMKLLERPRPPRRAAGLLWLDHTPQVLWYSVGGPCQALSPTPPHLNLWNIPRHQRQRHQAGF